jgi:hypothetical protein
MRRVTTDFLRPWNDASSDSCVLVDLLVIDKQPLDLCRKHFVWACGGTHLFCRRMKLGRPCFVTYYIFMELLSFIAIADQKIGK